MQIPIRDEQYDLLESLLWDGQSLFLGPAHMDRLQKAANFFGYPFDQIKIETELHQHCSGLPESPHKIRLLVDKDGVVTCQSIKISSVSQPIICRLAEFPIDTNSPFLYYKTTERSIYDQAMATLLSKYSDFEEVLLWNQKGELTESSRSNVVIERGGELFTPPVDCGLLAGTYRQYLLQKGKIQEGIIYLDELPTVRSFWLINSVRKWQPAQLCVSG